LCRDSEGEGSALNGWDGLTWLPKDLLSVFCGGMAAGDCPCDAANESSAQGVRYIDDFCIGNNCGIESKRGGGDLLTIAGPAGIGRLCGTHPEGVCKFWSFVSGPTFPSLFFAQQKIMMAIMISKNVRPTPLITMPQFLSPSSQNPTLEACTLVDAARASSS